MVHTNLRGVAWVAYHVESDPLDATTGATRMKLIHISFAGPFQTITDSEGEEWYFEMHRYCGPIVLRKDGDPRVNQPNSKSLFWPTVQLWIAQGKKYFSNGICEYAIPEPPTEDKL